MSWKQEIYSVNVGPIAERSKFARFRLWSGRPGFKSRQRLVLFWGWGTKWKPYCLLPQVVINYTNNQWKQLLRFNSDLDGRNKTSWVYGMHGEPRRGHRTYKQMGAWNCIHSSKYFFLQLKKHAKNKFRPATAVRSTHLLVKIYNRWFPSFVCPLSLFQNKMSLL